MVGRAPLDYSNQSLSRTPNERSTIHSRSRLVLLVPSTYSSDPEASFITEFNLFRWVGWYINNTFRSSSNGEERVKAAPGGGRLMKSLIGYSLEYILLEKMSPYPFSHRLTALLPERRKGTRTELWFAATDGLSGTWSGLGSSLSIRVVFEGSDLNLDPIESLRNAWLSSRFGRAATD